MGLWARLRGRETKAAGDSVLQLLRDIYGNSESIAGRNVTWKDALQVTTVLRCVSVIAEGVATVPLKIMRRTPDGRTVPATDHPLYDLLAHQPNSWQNSVEFRETLIFHLALVSNAYVVPTRDSRGRFLELIPFEPGKVRVDQKSDYSLEYELTTPSGALLRLPQSQVWHLRGASWNSWFGMECVRNAREAIGLSLATEEAHARLYANGVRPSGAWSIDGTLTDQQHKGLSDWISKHYSGLANAGKPLVMDRGAKWLSQAMSGVDAQHVETRKLQIEEVCRAFGVMPIMVGFNGDGSTYASAEQMFLAHAVHTLRPWHRRIEAAINTGLLTPQERADGYYAKFFDGELLRGAAKDRAEFYSRALGAGGSPAWLEINEVRGFEDMDAAPWGSGQPIPPNAPVASAGETINGAS
jgi:HK97 family phage portal protein